ncbi:MAG: hypothetical protein J0H22_02815 [Actinobacteria bacterium]|nr:hypothetical protein [Actinomycetota bacterium]
MGIGIGGSVVGLAVAVLVRAGCVRILRIGVLLALLRSLGRLRRGLRRLTRDAGEAAEESAAAPGAESPAGRAPIQVSFDDGAHHVEVAVDPDSAKGPVHVSLDPSNPTAPPRITTET